MSAESEVTRNYGLSERMVLVETTLGAVHRRMDELSGGTKDELKKISAAQVEISKDLKEVIAWMNRAKGWAAAALLCAGIIGAVLAKVFTKYF